MGVTFLSIVGWIKEDASYIRTFLFCIWGVWILWSFYKLPEAGALAKQYAKYLSHLNWLFIPGALSILSPFVARPIFDSVFVGTTPLDLYKTVLPVLTFLLGQMTVRRQQEKLKAESYEKIKSYIIEEMIQNTTLIKTNLDSALQELSYVKEGQINRSPMYLLKTKAIELALIQAPNLVDRDKLLDVLRSIQTTVEMHNTAVEFRRQIVLMVRATIPIAPRTDHHDDLIGIDEVVVNAHSKLINDWLQLSRAFSSG